MGLNHGPRDHFGQTAHRSDRQDGSPVGQLNQVDHRSRWPNKSPKSYLDQTNHRSTRSDRSPHARSSQMEQQSHRNPNSKFSSQRGLIRETVDSQANGQDCEMVTGANPTHRTVPEFLARRSRNPKNPCKTHSESQDSTQSVPGNSVKQPMTPSTDLRTYLSVLTIVP